MSEVRPQTVRAQAERLFSALILLVIISLEKEQNFCHGLGISNSTLLNYSTLSNPQRGRVSTPPADAQESLGLIFSQNRKSAPDLLGELAAGGLLIQLCLCKLLVEGNRGLQRQEISPPLHLLRLWHPAHFVGSCGSGVTAEERRLCRFQRAEEQLSPTPWVRAFVREAPWKVCPLGPGLFPPSYPGVNNRTGALSNGAIVKQSSSPDFDHTAQVYQMKAFCNTPSHPTEAVRCPLPVFSCKSQNKAF